MLFVYLLFGVFWVFALLGLGLMGFLGFLFCFVGVLVWVLGVLFGWFVIASVYAYRLHLCLVFCYG